MYELSERRMTLYKHAWVKRNFKALAQVCDSFGFAFAAAIRKEDERYTLLLEIFESLVGTRERTGGAKKNAVDAKRL